MQLIDRNSRSAGRLVTIVATLAVGVLGLPFGRAADEPGIVTREFIYESASYPECHASTIEQTPTGLVAAWFGGTYEKHPDVGIWVSRHENGQWTPSIEVANGVQYTQADSPRRARSRETDPAGSERRSLARRLTLSTVDHAPEADGHFVRGS